MSEGRARDCGFGVQSFRLSSVNYKSPLPINDGTTDHGENAKVSNEKPGYTAIDSKKHWYMQSDDFNAGCPQAETESGFG